MHEQSERKEYWLSRLQPNTKIFYDNNHEIDLESFLHKKTNSAPQFELNILVGVKEKIPARLIVCKLPQEAASRNRIKMKNNAKKHGRTPTAKNLALCDYNIFITNIEEEKLTIEECFILYRLRWQIELLFKLWKSHGKLGHSESEKPYRILCELYIKLLVVIVEHWIMLTGLWHIKERSLVKSSQMLREQSSRLSVVISDTEKLVELLKELSKRFYHGCSLNKRKKKPNAVDLLNSCSRDSSVQNSSV